jgi:hypothetical protein
MFLGRGNVAAVRAGCSVSASHPTGVATVLLIFYTW